MDCRNSYLFVRESYCRNPLANVGNSILGCHLSKISQQRSRNHNLPSTGMATPLKDELAIAIKF
jgi:hypothetical protein